jgi:hypothetical protein
LSRIKGGGGGDDAPLADTVHPRSPPMRIRALAKGNRGEEVKWLKSWLNLLVVPSPKLTVDDRFDDATAAAVLKFKLQNNIVPPTGTADIQVFTTIWLK